ncbi:hypothetical protein [Streptomyces sp. NPDC048584]|uniref:hypothetical protein n=1 Tax=Streptomyces sp. NPDC048584 TaxID=3365573 RepID=UPI00371F242A
MPSPDDPRPSSPPPSDLVDEVITRFDAYARARAARDSLLPAARSTPRHEQHAFESLQVAVTRLRNSRR